MQEESEMVLKKINLQELWMEALFLYYIQVAMEMVFKTYDPIYL